MSDFTLFIDSTCDLSEELYQTIGAKIIPYHFVLEGKEYPDDRKTMSTAEFYNKLRGGAVATTVQINTYDFVEEFTPELEAGRDVLYLCFASSCSGTYQAALAAEDELREKWPERKIYIIDTKAQSAGEGLLAYRTAEQKRAGMGIDELKSWVLENVDRHCHLFTIDDLNTARRSGRLSRASAVMGTLIGIKPVMYTDMDGVLSVGAKVRGRRQAINMLVDKFCEKAVNPEDQLILINQADVHDEAVYLADEIKKRVTVGKIEILPLGPVIGAHTGPGCLTLFFVGADKNW